MTHKVLRGALSSAQCERIIKYADNRWDSGNTIGTSNKRKSEIVWSEESWMYDIAKGLLKKVRYPFELISCEPLQISRYGVGGFYDFHYDGDGITPVDAPRTSIYYGKTRKLTMSFVLNNDFEGGDFEIYGLDKPIKMVMGDVLVFPSYFLHRVTPVTEGIRYSMQAWFVGNPLR